MAYIDVIGFEKADGELKAIYDEIISSRGKLADIHTIQSLNPQSVVNHMDLYMTLMFGDSPLSRVQREMIGVVVSKANDCDYCVAHHSIAVNHYWKDQLKTDQLINNYTKLNLSDIDRTLCNMAWDLTKSPHASNESYVKKLKKSGLEDRGILDAVLIISYFNFVNRLVLGLGLSVNEEEVGGYKY